MSKHRRWSWSFALWAWVFLLAGIAPLLLMPRASAAEESDPYPNSENTKSNLDIYYPQDGPMVHEDKEYTEGSFTVVNKNDTNGNENLDVQDGSVLVDSSALTADTSGATVNVADGSKFPEKVNNAPNRIRVADEDKDEYGHKYRAELAYIQSVNGNTITLTSPLSRVYEKDKNGRAEIGEVDLMKLVASTPTVTPTKNAILTVKKGNVKLYEDENKVTDITLKKLANNQWEIPPSQLPKTLWVEARETNDANLALHDIEIELEYDGVKDEVRATSVWSKRSHFWNTAKDNPNPPPAKILNGEEDEDEILLSFSSQLDSDLGKGVFHTEGQLEPLHIGAREETEFVLLPPGIGSYVGPDKPITVDMSRQAALRSYVVVSTWICLNDIDFPASGWNRFEIATDDANAPPPQPIDEDNVPAAGKDHVYGIDGPSSKTSESADFRISRVSFRTFARFKFGPNQAFVQPNFSVDGSRGSPLEEHHYIMYVKRAQKALGEVGTYLQDDANPSASFAVPVDGNPGKGTCEGTPDAANAVTEGWKVVYNDGTDTWAVTSTPPGSTGTLTKTDATHWTGKASNGGNVRIEITVTAGAVEFVNEDTFNFTTFKSTASDGKKYEIETGPCTVTDGP